MHRTHHYISHKASDFLARSLTNLFLPYKKLITRIQTYLSLYPHKPTNESQFSLQTTFLFIFVLSLTSITRWRQSRCLAPKLACRWPKLCGKSPHALSRQIALWFSWLIVLWLGQPKFNVNISTIHFPPYIWSVWQDVTITTSVVYKPFILFV